MLATILNTIETKDNLNISYELLLIIVGILLTAITAYFFNNLINIKIHRHTVSQKIIDKRISAYEVVYQDITMFNSYNKTNIKINNNCKAKSKRLEIDDKLCYRNLFNSKESIANIYQDIYEHYGNIRLWVSSKTKILYYNLHIYLNKLLKLISDKSDIYIINLGILLNNDLDNIIFKLYKEVELFYYNGYAIVKKQTIFEKIQEKRIIKKFNNYLLIKNFVLLNNMKEINLPNSIICNKCKDIDKCELQN